MSLVSCATEPTLPTFDRYPVTTIGHGAFFDADGAEFIPDHPFILGAQRYYIEILKEAGPSQRAEGDRTEEIEGQIRELVGDEALANALFLDWLLEQRDHPDATQIRSVNNGLRWHYLLEIQEDAILPVGDAPWSQGIDPEAAEQLEALGVSVFLLTKASGEEYRKECKAAGVPVPERVLDTSRGWTNLGEFDGEFVSASADSELWAWFSKDPEGVCLALPRWSPKRPGTTQEAGLLGVICQGNNTACFFDPPKGTRVKRGSSVSIENFLGGVALESNGKNPDICSDCHSGENAFVIHPDKEPFKKLEKDKRYKSTTGWYKPLVAASWPQNPGPSNVLDAVSSRSRCDACHFQPVAGRFPDVSRELPGYCAQVLKAAVGQGIGGIPRTMPPLDGKGNQPDIRRYGTHLFALLFMCSAERPLPGVFVDFEPPGEDDGRLSPPLVIGPLYACASQVAVRGAVLDAEVELTVKPVSGNTRTFLVNPARNPDQIEFTNVGRLAKDDQVSARQRLAGGPWSRPSKVVTVRHFKDDFTKLPAPTIDPTLIYECASEIAVRHIPGAEITVIDSNGARSSRGTSTGYSVGWPRKQPFAVGDTFKAVASLCGETSDESPVERAVKAPSQLPEPRLNPGIAIEDQELVSISKLTNGSTRSVQVVGVGSAGSFQSPVSWYPNYDVKKRLGRSLRAGEELHVEQKLCGVKSEVATPPTRTCKDLPAPKIRHPIVGEDFIEVQEAQPGARIKVYDGSRRKLGDGSGTIILLSRALTGADTLTVIQTLGSCVSKKGYRTSVRNAEGTDFDP